MKNLIKISVLALAATTLMVSCQRETAFEEAPVSNTARTFTITFAQPDSKVAITDAGKTTWEVGDEILVHGEYTDLEAGKSIVVKLTAADISSDGKKATISVEGVTPYVRDDGKYKSTLYASYPASATADKEHCYYYADFNNTKAPLMAAFNVDDTFVFYNLTGIISFQVTGDFDKFTFEGNAEEEVGYGYYRAYLALNPDDTHYLDFKKKAENPVKVYEAALTTGTNYVYLPVGANFASGFTFKFYKGDELVKTAKTEKAVNVVRNGILALGDITSKLESEAPAYVDLSEGGQATANCYIVSAAGAYKFPAVKGNTTESVGTVASAALVWETYNNAEEVAENSVIAEVSADAEAVYFKTPETLKPGNALIAAKDADGKILWSWHIWIPSTPITSASYKGMFGSDAMSRNLGALVDAAEAGAAVESCGLLYQWGRKDPFMGLGAMAANSGTVAKSSKAFADRSNVQISVEESIANPTMFAFNGETAVDPTWKGLSWCSSDIENPWGTAEAKGLYDPCPAGYRVPAYDDSKAGWKTSDWTYDFDKFFYKYDEALFPFAGYLDDCSGSLSHGGDRSAFWSATAYDADRGRSIDVRLKSGAASHSQATQYKARGNSVRCVSVEASTTPDDPPTTTDVKITIDGDVSEWAGVTGSSSGNHEFKVASDETNIYFYSHRNADSRYSEIWGGGGYIYVGFDLDGDATTGETLNGKGPYEFVFFVTPYGGSSDTPAIADDFLTLGYGADCLPTTATVEHIVGKGVIDASGVAVEFSIPRADMPEVPTTAVKVVSVGNKDLASVTINALL